VTINRHYEVASYTSSKISPDIIQTLPCTPLMWLLSQISAKSSTWQGIYSYESGTVCSGRRSCDIAANLHENMKLFSPFYFQGCTHKHVMTTYTADQGCCVLIKNEKPVKLHCCLTVKQIWYSHTEDQDFETGKKSWRKFVCRFLLCLPFLKP
jgi:hypothetical protein